MNPEALLERAARTLDGHSDFLIEKGKFHCHACGWEGPRVNDHRAAIALAVLCEYPEEVIELLGGERGQADPLQEVAAEFVAALVIDAPFHDWRNAPGHDHETPGVWDGSGVECSLCQKWDSLCTILAAVSPLAPGTSEGTRE